MPMDKEKYARFLQEYAEQLDISPSKFTEAAARYNAVGDWLTSGTEGSAELNHAQIYVQGSFRLGTVVRPVRSAKEGDYDIDLVCQLPTSKTVTTPQATKHCVGDRLKSHDKYLSMLDDEGKRCWTLQYAEQDGIGFHLDVLPAAGDVSPISETAIAITDNVHGQYSWSSSDPNGLALWFEGRNSGAFLRERQQQKAVLFARNPQLFSGIDDVPDQLVKTPLQRAIQILKRHRDLLFDGSELSAYRPISIIITTLAAELYNGESDVYSALKSIVEGMCNYTALLESQAGVSLGRDGSGLIRRQEPGGWYIANPVNAAENFADRWHEDGHARARAFFGWVRQVNIDLVEILGSYERKHVRASLSAALGATFINSHFDALWPITNPKPHIKPVKTELTGGQKPWRRD